MSLSRRGLAPRVPPQVIRGVGNREFHDPRPDLGRLRAAYLGVVPTRQMSEHQAVGARSDGNLSGPAAGQVNPPRQVPALDERAVDEEKIGVAGQVHERGAVVSVAAIGDDGAVPLDPEAIRLDRMVDAAGRDPKRPHLGDKAVRELPEVELPPQPTFVKPLVCRGETRARARPVVGSRSAGLPPGWYRRWTYRPVTSMQWSVEMGEEERVERVQMALQGPRRYRVDST